MAADRRNCNYTRTGWEALHKREGRAPVTFGAERGFLQGAAESPLLWILFYDMVLCQMRREDVGKSVILSGVAGEPVQAGLSDFADDTAFLERTAEEAQRSAAVVEAVLALVCLKLAPAKSLHMVASYVDSPVSGRLSRTVDEITAAERVVIGGITVPLVGADEGLRYLGFQMDGLCDWGDQAAYLPTDHAQVPY